MLGGGKTFRRHCVNFSKRLIQQIRENILIFHTTHPWKQRRLSTGNEVRQPKAVIQVDTLAHNSGYTL